VVLQRWGEGEVNIVICWNGKYLIR
jgi:hypothetical protein